ncbi:hypothetical protein ACIOHS_32555 [Streptomyces sp. NPDC088253]|uniref:hypothetical protein n=1 Tax=Streptomyces sp. NPDC088253 TaxID=3365846 RepID=UPI00381682D7
MRRTVRVLSATALACAALGAAATAASADPGAEVDPRSVGPGGLLSISVTCDAIGGTQPESIDAHSQGFEGGKVQLHRVIGGDEKTGGAASYRGTARIPAGGTSDGGSGGLGGVGGLAGVGGFGVAGGTGGQFNSDSDAGDREAQWAVNGVCPVAPGGQERPWNTSYTVSHGTSTGVGTSTGIGTGTSTGVGTSAGRDTGTGRETGAARDTGAGRGTGATHDTGAGRDTGTGRDTGASHDTGAGRDTGATHDTGAGRDTGASHDTGTGRETGADHDTGTGRDTGADHDTAERPAGAQYGVQGGEGGAFTDSVPALVTGGVLIVGALGAALHRLRQKGSSNR